MTQRNPSQRMQYILIESKFPFFQIAVGFPNLPSMYLSTEEQLPHYFLISDSFQTSREKLQIESPNVLICPSMSHHSLKDPESFALTDAQRSRMLITEK